MGCCFFLANGNAAFVFGLFVCLFSNKPLLKKRCSTVYLNLPFFLQKQVSKNRVCYFVILVEFPFNVRGAMAVPDSRSSVQVWVHYVVFLGKEL